MSLYIADFTAECERCGHSPCVIARDVERHGTQFHDTKLCGVHFFHDRMMIDPELWNEPREATE